MKLFSLCLLAISLVWFSPGSVSGSTIEYPEPFNDESAHWLASDESGADVWLIKMGDGTLKIFGKDMASSYEGLITQTETGDIECTGTGFNFITGLSFGYRSKFTVEKIEDGSFKLKESWTATFANGEAISGESQFLKAADGGTR